MMQDSTHLRLSILERYYDLIAGQAKKYEKLPNSGDFEPGMRLPELDAKVVESLAPVIAGFSEPGAYGGIPLRLLDLRRNPSTQTAKTFHSLSIVARRRGKHLSITSPLSTFNAANKFVVLCRA
jgi:hypothetical protein